ncbi:Dorsal-ventral patterning protein Sog [Papilio machaon]|uniref:Dorsal-ventral patterning protein Sog n=1 Tax=Papilio machaon TaxID=76193 RepID=A0A194QY05_PAPMA|nr:Dorsal-ventral patterning protein Sog [Papilio machaon]
MYCIKCECISVQKKRRVVAKVHCRNIKNECPEPSCDTPVLLPGRCCKTCPGDVDSSTYWLTTRSKFRTTSYKLLQNKLLALLERSEKICSN